MYILYQSVKEKSKKDIFSYKEVGIDERKQKKTYSEF